MAIETVAAVHPGATVTRTEDAMTFFLVFWRFPKIKLTDSAAHCGREVEISTHKTSARVRF